MHFFPKGPSVEKPISGTTGMWLAHYILNRCDRSLAEPFFARLQDGVMLQTNDPIYVMRERLLKKEGKWRITDNNDRLELIFRCWNHHVEGNRVEFVKLTGKEIPVPLRWPSEWPRPGHQRTESDELLGAHPGPKRVRNGKLTKVQEALELLRKEYGYSVFSSQEATVLVSDRVGVARSSLPAMLASMVGSGNLTRLSRGVYQCPRLSFVLPGDQDGMENGLKMLDKIGE